VGAIDPWLRIPKRQHHHGHRRLEGHVEAGFQQREEHGVEPDRERPVGGRPDLGDLLCDPDVRLTRVHRAEAAKTPSRRDGDNQRGIGGAAHRCEHDRVRDAERAREPGGQHGARQGVRGHGPVDGRSRSVDLAAGSQEPKGTQGR
jgi:hypothetical protein